MYLARGLPGRFVRACRPIVFKNTVRKFKNFVTSEVLEQLDFLCDKVCPGRIPPRKVCVIGAGSYVGRMMTLMLKQQNVINYLSLYDDKPCMGVLGVAHDVSHIDTSVAVEAYQGRRFLKDAVYDADVVVVCGGHHVNPPCCTTSDRSLFFENMQLVRTAALATAEFAPHAVLCIQVPPVDANFTLASYTLKINCKLDPRRVIGVNSINSMRANQLICSITGADPSSSHVPVVGGTTRCTRVPVFSTVNKSRLPQSQIECLTKLVREADDIICKVKFSDETGHLSIGYSTARLVTGVMQGLFEKTTFIDSALVWQADPKKAWGLEVCATPISVGKGGIDAIMLPTLSPLEKSLLDENKCILLDLLHLGRCAAYGDEYCYHKCMYPPCPSKQN